MIRYRRQSNILKPVFGSSLNWGHPLAGNMAACWLCNENKGTSVTSLVNANDILLFQNTVTWKTQPFGVSPTPNTTANNGLNLASPSTPLKAADALSVFYRGFATNDINQSIAQGPSLIGMSFTNSNTSPFTAYGIFRPSSDPTGLSYIDDAGGTQHSAVAGSILPTVANVISAGLTFKNGGNCIGYFLGRQVVSNARSGSFALDSGRKTH